MANRYFFINEFTRLQQKGSFWLSPVLGSEFLYRESAPIVVHITGYNHAGDHVSGTGIVIDRHYVLTCRHVVEDMTLDDPQHFQNGSYSIQETFSHPEIDVAVIRVNSTLKTKDGLAFFLPEIGQHVFSMGYPKIPFTKHSAPLTMQSGSVTNESVELFSGQKVFLYSAVARPGNSGGPIFSENGYIVGITSEDLSSNEFQPEQSVIFPHYAGISSSEIAKAIESFGLTEHFPYERFD